MKQKLLSLVALASAMFVSTSAFAQWAEPTAPVLDKTNVSAVESGKSYYVMNVGAGQFLTGSNSWSTQVSLTRDGVNSEYSPALVIYVADSVGTIARNSVAGVSLRLDGTFTVNGASGKRTFTDTYLFRDSEESSFMDHGSQDKGYIWKITKASNGYFRIQTADGDAAFPDAATQYAGWDGSNGPIEVDENGDLVLNELGEEPSTVVVFNMTEDDENIDWAFIDPTAFLVQKVAYESRKALYDLLVSTTELGYEVNTNAATAVYNNPNATKEELENAYVALKAAINRAYFEDILGGATDEDPIDATEYVLVNPDFETGNIDGWTTNYVSGKQANNIGYQGSSYTNGDVTISKFIEAWKSDGSPWTIGDGYLQQTVYGLPAGKYVLEADAVSVYQWSNHDADGGIGKNPAEGVYLFIQAGDREAKVALATGNGQPEHFSITYISKGDDELTFGLKTEKATANWIAADNFQIFYHGQTKDTPAQADLKTVIQRAENVDTNLPANAEDLEAFEKALENAQAVYKASGDDDACLAAQEALTAAMQKFENCAKAYESFYTYFGSGGEYESLITQVMEHPTWGDLADDMDKLATELLDKYSAYTLTLEEAEASQGQLQQLLLDFINPENVKEGDDLTLLLKNPGFEDGLNGWTKGRGDAWTVFEGVDYHEVESWHQNFDLYQIIPNMPAGVYNISVQGFARMDDANMTVPTIELYAGNSTARFPSISQRNGLGPDEYSLEQLYYVDGGSFNDTEMTMSDGTTVYVPNGMAGAQVFFAQDNPLTGKPFYQRQVKITLREAGDLRIGVRSNSTSEWVLWDNMKITYAGNSLELYYEMIEDAQAAMMNAYNAEGAFVTKKAAADVDALNGRVDKMEELSTADEALALIAEIEAATDYIAAGAAKGVELQNAIDVYNELSARVNSSDQAFPALLTECQKKVESPNNIESNEAVDDIIASIKKAWPGFVLYDAGDEPTEKFEATPIIYNNDYIHPIEQTYSSEGWTIENVGGTCTPDFNELEAYNNDSIYIYQDLSGLKPGFYEIALQGYYRAGYSGSYNDADTALGDSLKQVHNVFIYATSSLGEMTTPLLNAIEGAQEASLGMGSETAVMNLEGIEVYIPENMEAASYYFQEEYYPNSLKVQVGEDGNLRIAIRKWNHITGDWTIFTNWQLFYLGKTGANFADELTAVESLSSANAKAAQVFSIDGRQMSRLNRGINIVRMSDGSVRKVMVK